MKDTKLLTILITLIIIICNSKLSIGKNYHYQININTKMKNKIYDIDQLHKLIQGVGDDHSHNTQLNNQLKKINIKKLRLINVDLINNAIINGKLQAKLLDRCLDWCKQINADPHIIIGQGIPAWFSSHEKNYQYGPNDPQAYKDYLIKYFHHVMIERGFDTASWEVANEPDLRGAPYPTYPRPKSPNASEQDYRAYLAHYKLIAEAAQQFEKEKGHKIILGGPAITGGASYRFTKFNWYEKFLQDVAREGLKLDFFSFHFYGNRAALGNRKNYTPIPTFDQIMNNLHQWIKDYRPGLPIWITEWGPASHTNKMIPAAFINANNVGAAWTAAFIFSMLQHHIDQAFYLLVADIRQDWAWPALFHGTTPKPAFYVFEFFQKLSGQLVDVQGGSTAVGALASQKDGQVKVVIWNYDWQRGDDDVGTEGAREEEVLLSFTGLAPTQKHYHLSQTEISEGYGNPFLEKLTGKIASPDPLTRDLGVLSINDGKLDVRIKLPPSSVVFLEARTTDLSN